MSAIETFRKNLEEVEGLINFDRELLQVVWLTVNGLHEHLKSRTADERYNGKRALDTIRGIRENESVRSKYEVIYNQAIVLLVSYFASALGDLFRQAVTERLTSSDPGKLLEEEFKITVTEMKDKDWNLQGAIPDLLIAKYDYTFQDMGATVRAFTSYTTLTPQRDQVMNNIIAAQACRHVIVHSGGRVTDRTVKQLLKVSPRELKREIATGDQLQFSLFEVKEVMANMTEFIERLATSERCADA